MRKRDTGRAAAPSSMSAARASVASFMIACACAGACAFGPPAPTAAAARPAGTAPPPAQAASPPFDPQDDDALREARAFERLVLESRPPAVGETAQTGVFIDFGRGPVQVHVPASYDPATPTPLVILLHGYTNTGADVEAWMQLSNLVDEYGFLYLYPTGTEDLFGNPYWNATDACCSMFGDDVDDSGYLRDVIETMRANYNVDERRIHFAGHSNGGFMSYRMACDHADVVASIASLSGATFLDPADCTPSAPVHTLEMHGTADGVISYTGGCIPFGGCFPGAVQTVETWASYDGCSPVGQPIPGALDLDASIPGAETSVTRYATDCAEGGSAELWTINGGPHSPDLSASFSRLVIEFLFDHPKPTDCAEDLDGDGDVGFDDLLAVLANWGPCAGCPQDLDMDGEVGFGDVLAVLSTWGPC